MAEDEEIEEVEEEEDQGEVYNTPEEGGVVDSKEKRGIHSEKRGNVEKPEVRGRDTVLKRVALRKGIGLEDAKALYGPILDAAYHRDREDRDRILPSDLVEDLKALADVGDALDPATRQYVQLLAADRVEKVLSGGGSGGRDARLNTIMDRVEEIKLQDTLVKGLVLGEERKEGDVSPAIQQLTDIVAGFVQAVEKREEEKEKSLAEKAFEKIDALQVELKRDKARERKSMLMTRLDGLEQAIKAIQSQPSNVEASPPPGFKLRLSDGTVLEGEEAIGQWEEIKAERALDRKMKEKQFDEDLEDRRKDRQLKEEKVKLLKEFPGHIIDAIDRVLQEEDKGGEGGALSFEGSGVLDVQKCPSCGTDIPIPRSHGGKVICPNDKCNAVFKVTVSPPPETEKEGGGMPPKKKS